MFHFGGFPSYTYVFSIWSCILHAGGFPIRKSADRNLFAAPRSLSQLVTSFVGSWCQGIPLMLFLAWTSSLNSLLHEFRFSLAWIAVYHVFYSYFFSLLAKLFNFTLLSERPSFWFPKMSFLLSLYLFVYFEFFIRFSMITAALTAFNLILTRLYKASSLFHAKALYNPIFLQARYLFSLTVRMSHAYYVIPS